ncbi:hypothetical protein [Pedobacter mucosus]|uniref:hypothetical protein n=1 Tax=Pedobacter mucosus TaxID=2895286 RepID=UPI001EE4D8B5|nr:hypothetical protein [Pedobacter mucosus]UKT62532.1 hypothetical protein LOK61_12265 [Pedobacter mucosus]
MKISFPVLVIALAFLTSCQSNSSKNETADLAKTDTVTNIKECFLYINKMDTATLSLNAADKHITGTLSYNLFEKDKNNGVISGIVKGDTIIADYAFQSEGQNTIRQVVWLRKGDQLIEGFGDIAEVNGKTIFKKISDLKFEQSMVFEKTECK